MKSKPQPREVLELLQSHFDQILNRDHKLNQLAGKMNWSRFEVACADSYSEDTGGRLLLGREHLDDLGGKSRIFAPSIPPTHDGDDATESSADETRLAILLLLDFISSLRVAVDVILRQFSNVGYAHDFAKPLPSKPARFPLALAD